MARKILLIDDDEEYVAALSCMLTNHGYDVVTAHNGPDGIALAQTQRPDLILLDNMMSTDLEGFEVARTLNQDEQLKHVPIIMITATRQMMDLPFEIKPVDHWLPVKAVLDKPVKMDALLQMMEEFIKH